jgi:hypothetical protein
MFGAPALITNWRPPIILALGTISGSERRRLSATRGVSQNRRFHQLRAAASSREGLAGLSEDDFAEWMAVARANAADSRHGKPPPRNGRS